MTESFEGPKGFIDMKKDPDQITARFVGRLGELGLGREGGIPSDLAGASTEQLKQYATILQDELVEINDGENLSCIDGRHVEANIDGTESDIRLRRVGGSASNLEVSLNAGNAIATSTLLLQMNERIKAIDAYVTKKTGYLRSAHEGGCGGANGAVEDNENIANHPEIMEAVKAFMDIPEVREATGVDFDAELGESVCHNAAKTAKYLRENNWDGQKYVEGVQRANPHGDEQLHVEHDEFHGHKERAVVAVLGENMTLAIDGIFVWNVNASVKIAKGLAGDGDDKAYIRTIMAEFAKHMAVCYRLPSKETPLFVVG